MEKQYPSQIADKVLVRLPVGMKALLVERTKESHRSLGREALVLMERGLAAEAASSQP